MRFIMVALLSLLWPGWASAADKVVGIVWQGGAADQSNLDALKAALAAQNLAYNLIVPDQNPAAQMDAVSRAVAERPNVVILYAKSAFPVPATDELKQSGIPVLYYNSVPGASDGVVVAYDWRKAGKLLADAGGPATDRRVAILAEQSGNPRLDVIASGIRETMANTAVLADCGGCPKTGECPKAQLVAACPCPKTGECPKSDIAQFLASLRSASTSKLTIFSLSDTLDAKIREAAADSNLSNLTLIGGADSLDAVKNVADGVDDRAIWYDPKPLGAAAANVAARLADGAKVGDIHGATPLALASGSIPAIFLDPSLIEKSSAISVMSRQP